MSKLPLPNAQLSALSGDAFTLDHLQVGAQGKIAGIQADPELKQRLAALGLRAGSKVHVLRKAVFGGPVHVRVGTTEVIMRLKEAKRIVAVPMIDGSASPANKP